MMRLFVFDQSDCDRESCQIQCCAVFGLRSTVGLALGSSSAGADQGTAAKFA